MNKKGYLNKLMLAALALLMSFSVSLKAYAADVPSLDTSKAKLLEKNPGIVLSDFYVIETFENTYSHLFIRSDSVKDNFLLYKYYYSDDVYDIRFGFYSDGVLSDLNVHFDGANYDISDYSFRTLVGNETINLIGNYYVKDLKSLETNIPYFDSASSAISFYDSGDTSGLLNPDNVPKAYSKDIETPKDLRVDMDADFRAQMGYAPGNGDEDVDASNSYCKFTWSQSDEVVEAGNYVTEIYYQTSFVHHSNPLCIGSKTFSLSSSKLVAAVPVDKVNMSYTMDFSRIEEIYQDWLDAGLIGGTMKPTYPTEPYYFYVRNVVGNTYGNWVRVTVNNDNVSVSNSITGANTVTGGYAEIDGSTATLPDVNQKLDGDVVNDSQYGINYRVDIDKESYNDIITFIKNGFGLLGEDGLIAFFKSVFSFLPEPVWAMIFCMVGTCVVFIVVKVAIG